LRCLEELRTTESIGRPNALRAFSGSLENSVITAVQFVHDLLTAEEYKAVMSERVVANRMISSCYFRHNLRIPAYIFAKNEKSCGHIVSGKKRQKARCHFRVWTVVKCQRASDTSSPHDPAK